MQDELPLAGIRVVSLAINVPGPIAAARLAALGADVTKVEPPSGDFLAVAASAWYAALVERQHVVALDLKRDDGRAALDAMLARADVLVVSSRPRALARLGLDRDVVRARHQRLCVVSIVGHPSPAADRPGHDLTYQAEAGLVTPPDLPVTLFSDVATAFEAVASALALLLARARSGAGGWCEVSLLETARALAQPLRHGLTNPGGVLGGGFPGYALYEAIDGTVAIAALEPHFMARLLEHLIPDAPDGEAIARRIREHTVDHWVTFGRAHDIPIARVSAA
jgi:alpha-methylacyl-CoA racemase